MFLFCLGHSGIPLQPWLYIIMLIYRLCLWQKRKKKEKMDGYCVHVIQPQHPGFKYIKGSLLHAILLFLIFPLSP